MSERKLRPTKHIETTTTVWEAGPDPSGIGCVIMILVFLLFCACCGKAKSSEIKSILQSFKALQGVEIIEHLRNKNDYC